MKPIRIKQATLAALAALTLAGVTDRAQAQTFITDSYTNKFDTGGNTTPFTGGSVASWLTWYNSPGNNLAMTNDVTMDAGNDPSSGSLQVISPLAGYTQNVFFGTFGNGYGYDRSTRANMLLYTNITFDIRVATNTPPGPQGDFGTIGVAVVTYVAAGDSWTYAEMGRPRIPAAASNGWVHLSVNINHTLNNITDVPAIAFNINSYSDNYPLFTITNWIDNLQVHLTPGPPPPPPTTYLEPTTPGLAQFADAQPSYNRQSIRTDTTGTADLTWYGRPKPVNYSFTIADWPKPGHGGFAAGLTITSDTNSSQIYSDPDWSATNCIWLNLNAQNDGRVFAGISYKTNLPGANSNMFNFRGQLIPGNNTNGLIAPSAIGKWTLTFTSDTDLTITAPNGAVTNTSLPADVAAGLNGPVGVFLYSSPANDANIGQRMTFSAYSISNVATPFNEDLTDGTLDTPFLLRNSQGYFYTGNYTPTPPNQVFATSADAYWYHWSLPDAGFSTVSRTSVAPGTFWNDLPSTIFTSGGQHWTKVPKSNLPGANQGFFGLVKRVFTQLQVLLPGESAAPNTPTGKTGSPTPLTLSSPNCEVTVRSVDSAWNLVSSTDMVQLTTTDPTASVPFPLPLTAGTITFDVNGGNYLAFGSNGVWTVTASDVTNTNILSNTSPPVTVTP